MWVPIRWLHQKPADLDLHCFQKKYKSKLSRTRAGADPGFLDRGFKFSMGGFDFLILPDVY